MDVLSGGRIVTSRGQRSISLAANLGFHNSLEGLRRLYADGHASKEEYFDALRAYQAAVEATKSKEREKVEEDRKNGKIVYG